jgi:class 3 adenylate cyclase/TolB-like protein
MTETRKLVAILVADVVGYSRLAGADEDRTLARLRGLRSDLIDPAIAANHGRIVKRTGDGSIVEFRSVVDAVRCATEVQNGLIERNAGLPPERRIEFRVGIHVGDVVEEADGDLMGDGVNIAARLEGICEPGGICLSEDAYRQVKSRLELRVADLGPQNLKNIAEPVRAYLLRQGAPTVKSSAGGARKRRSIYALSAALAAVAVSVGGYAWHSELGPRLMGAAVVDDKLKSASRYSIIVLPFENLSGDPDQQYLADGITDDLTTDLSSHVSDFVIARNTAFTYKGKSVDVRQIGRELGVRYVLEGSVRRLGDKIEINAQLISTETGAHAWADRFEGDKNDLGKLQFEVVARLAYALGIEINKAEALRAARERPRNPDATDLNLRTNAILWEKNETKSDWNDAIEMSERSIALDPQNAWARINLASALASRVENKWSEDAAHDLARAEELINSALTLQPDQTWAHWSKGYILSLKRQWKAAFVENDMAIADDRSNAKAYAKAALYKMYLGRSADGIADIETALRLSPHDNDAGNWQVTLCRLRAHLAQWEKAIEECEKAVAVRPSDTAGYIDLIAANAWTGHDRDAKEAVSQLQELVPNGTVKSLLQGAYDDDPTYNAEVARISDGLRKAGLPEK